MKQFIKNNYHVLTFLFGFIIGIFLHAGLQRRYAGCEQRINAAHLSTQKTVQTTPALIRLPYDSVPVKDTIPCDTCVSFVPMWRTFGDSNLVVISIDDKNNIAIHGDSLRAIKLLLELNKKSQERHMELYGVLTTSVAFANTVTDHFKNSPEWKAYAKEIKKQGYKIKKMKP